MKTKKILLSTLFIAGCASQNVYVPENESLPFASCPKVELKKADEAIIQTDGHQKLFKIEVVGYNGSCYYDERVLKDKAVVAPQFKITRLNISNVEDVHFSYYVQTYEGPTRFLGKKTYFAKANMPVGVNQIIYTPKSAELSVETGKHAADLYIGLNAESGDFEYKVK